MYWHLCQLVLSYIYLCSQIKNNKFAHMLVNIGRLGLLLLSVHSLDYMFSFSKAIVYTWLSLEGKGASLLFDSMLFIIPLFGIVFLPVSVRILGHYEFGTLKNS